MLETQHPSYFEPRLQPEYLDRFCQEVSSVAYGALEDSTTQYDTAYTRGTLLFGRLQGLSQVLGKDKSLPWLELRNATLDFTVSVNGVLFQVVTDNPQDIRKTHRIKANPLEQHQLSLFEVSPEVCTWRVYLSSNQDPEFSKIETAIVGFDANQNVVCLWKHEQRSGVSVRAMEQHPQVDVTEAQPRRKKKDADTDTADDVGPIDG